MTTEIKTKSDKLTEAKTLGYIEGFVDGKNDILNKIRKLDFLSKKQLNKILNMLNDYNTKLENKL